MSPGCLASGARRGPPRRLDDPKGGVLDGARRQWLPFTTQDTAYDRVLLAFEGQGVGGALNGDRAWLLDMLTRDRRQRVGPQNPGRTVGNGWPAGDDLARRPVISLREGRESTACRAVGRGALTCCAGPAIGGRTAPDGLLPGGRCDAAGKWRVSGGNHGFMAAVGSGGGRGGLLRLGGKGGGGGCSRHAASPPCRTRRPCSARRRLGRERARADRWLPAACSRRQPAASGTGLFLVGPSS